MDYLQTKGCRRAVLAKHFDQSLPLSCREHAEEVVYCDYCESQALERLKLAETHGATATSTDAPWADVMGSKETTKAADAQTVARYGELSGQQTIARVLYREAKDDGDMLGLMLRLKQNCLFCTLTFTERGPSIWGPTHATLDNCEKAMELECQLGEFHRWRAGIDLKGFRHCYICGLPQDMCRFVESGRP